MKTEKVESAAGGAAARRVSNLPPLLEKGKRRAPENLAVKAVRFYRLSEAMLLVTSAPDQLPVADEGELASDLAGLSYSASIRVIRVLLKRSLPRTPIADPVYTSWWRRLEKIGADVMPGIDNAPKVSLHRRP